MEAKAWSFTITLVIAFTMLGQHSMVKGDPNTTVLTGQCSPAEIGEDYVYKDSLEEAINYVTSHIPDDGFDVRISKPDVNPRVYVHGTCNENLGSSDCAVCFSAVIKYLDASYPDGCEGKIGANVVLQDCSIRYEVYEI